ncbi:protein CURLY FLAG LEAF 1-like isoform X1 [Musa acuminata AAA Group]|uniref:protein CURLY FLAG LEAF 1-like isoform X1 n=1 Tax=Musa acuminata AAA Group TaxID=214697 RepID=UPI0031D3546B
MTAPNIEMIAALLRSCNLGRGGDRVSPPSAAARRVEPSDESAGEVTVELNSETALPYHWEQCLDMRTGEVYYINRETGTRTSKDPRTAVAAATYSSSYHSEEDVSSDDDSCSGVGGSDDHEDSVDTANSCLTSLSSTSTSDTSAEPSGGHILVSAGCRSCFMYFMVPKSIDACPKCGGRLLKLGRDGCV